MTIQEFVNKWNGRGIDLFDLKMPKMGLMSSLMVSPISNDKIFDSVISFNSINMVNNFRRFQKSTQMLFHYKTMLTKIFVILRSMIGIKDHSVTAVINSFATFPAATIFSFTKKLTFRITNHIHSIPLGYYGIQGGEKIL